MTTVESSETPIPKILLKMGEEDRNHLLHLAEKKAWLYASSISPFTDKEQTKIARAEKKGGPRAAKLASDRLHRRHHWNSLRWFLFGGYVDIPGLESDPLKAYDPISNPWVKIRVPGFVWTKDEHDQANPFKRLPDKDYLRLLSYAWVYEPLLAIPKSRQMMVTWLFCSIAVHETMARAARNTAVISKKFDDADAHIEKRIKSIWDKLPTKFTVPKSKYKTGELYCPGSDSTIMAMGEEAKGLRQYTFSWVFFDETAFADQASEIIGAGLPTVKGGGRFTLVSSANGEEQFYSICSENGRIALPPGR